MATETEIETLVVRLTGDGSNLQKMLLAAQGQVQAFGTSVQNVIGAATSALASLGAKAFLESAAGEWDKREEAMIRMSATLRANGRDVEATTAAYSAFAKSMSEVSTASVGEIKQLLRTAETFGLTGKQAQQATRNAINLAQATEVSNETALRITRLIAQGEIEQAMRRARSIPQLARITDETKFLTEVNRLLGVGISVNSDLIQTNNFQMERASRAWKGLKGDLGEIVDRIMAPLAKALMDVANFVRGMSTEMKEAIVYILMTTSALLAIAPAIAAFQFFAAPLMSLVYWLGMLAFQLAIVKPLQIASLAVWVAWKAVMLLVNGVILLFNVQLAAWNFLLSASAISSAAISVAMLVWKGVVWLVNIALGVMNSLLSVGVLLATVGTVGILVTVFTALAGAVMGAYHAGKAIFEVLGSLSTTTGPIGHISDMFGEWYAILSDVVRVAQVNMPFAWQLLQAGFALAIAQIKDLWPPLWTFIQSGFTALITTVREQFILSFNQVQSHISVSIDMALGIGDRAEQQEALRNSDRFYEAQRRRSTEAATAAVRAAAGAFNVTDSPATIAARAEVERLRGQIPEVIAAAAAKAANDATGQGEAIGRNLGRGIKDKLDAALSRSAEAIGRISAYRSGFSGGGRPGIGGTAGALAPAVSGGGGGGASSNPQLGAIYQVLKEMLELQRGRVAPAIEIAAAGFGGEW